ncbi:MAG: ATP-binding cassette domain-containing protein [Alphaproteobacteria bacterium]
MLSIHGLSRAGLGPVDLTLPDGQCLAVMGTSGAGKTLLLRAIADLDPNDGQVLLDTVPRDSMPAPAWRRQVCYVAPESGWWADSVGTHFPDWDLAAPIAARMALPADVRGWSVARLSTGERQRLALARAFVLNPRVLLLDEPTSGLDADTGASVESILAERLAGGTSVLLVTHDPAQAQRLAGRVLRLVAGRIEEMA